MGKLETFPAVPPMPAVARILSRFDRNQIGNAIEVMIALLDVADPDPDAEGSTWPEDIRSVDRERLPDDSEACGDEQDGNGAEDEPAAWFESLNGAAGCPVADPGEYGYGH